jgi:hypothetical protein
MAGQVDLGNLVEGCMLLKVNAGGKAVKVSLFFPTNLCIKFTPPGDW